MKDGYFNIKRDLAIENDGGFWCYACLIGKPKSEMSPDYRYCQDCYELLLKEAELLPMSKRPGWIPKPQTKKPTEAKIEGGKQYHIVQPIDNEKTKMSTLNSPSLTVDNFRPRGRQTTYKKKELPEPQIKQLHNQGMGAKAIATQLKREKGIIVSYKTIQRLLAGQR